MGTELVAQTQANMQLATKKQNVGLNVFADADSFNLALRMANGLAQSTIVPKAYQGNVGNCMIAIEMAARINTSPMMVMQNLYIVNGNPSWSSQWIIAMINNSGRYKTELQFEFGHDPEDEGLSCRAWAEDFSGHRVEGPKITMKMAREEGWTTKSGSKWKTMPEVMIRYRAASFFGRVNCPDMVMGIYTREEVYDMGDAPDTDLSEFLTNPETGEVISIGEDPIITQEQRKLLFRMAKQSFGDEAEEIVSKLIQENGLESTANMTTSVYNKVIEQIVALSEARNGGEDPKKPEKPENTEGEDLEPGYTGGK